MKGIVVVILFGLWHTIVSAQDYPFQNPYLDDEIRLDYLISLLTLDEKINCFSTRPAVQQLGINGTRMVEGLHGLALSGPANWAVKGRGASPTTTFPQACGRAQMWDPELLAQVASLEAEEARYLAQSPKYKSAGLILLAPNADLGRDVRWGRTEECYGDDAFLTSRMVVAFVKGMQGNHPIYWKTASIMNHFLANSNENMRLINSSDFDDRLFREFYSYPFFRGMTEGGARGYMSANNKYNGITFTVHPMHRNITIKKWGQNGLIATDGGAYQQMVNAHKYYPDLYVAAAECIKAGITMFLDRFQIQLKEAVSRGLVTEKEIDGAVRGNMRVLLKLGMLDNSPENPYTRIGMADTVDIWTKPSSHELVRKATARSVMLLKNDSQLLPVRLVYAANPKTIQVVISSFPYAVNWSKEHVPAILHITQSSKELGNGLADVLFGKVSPAGRLVQTWPKAIEDLGPMLDYNIRHGKTYQYSLKEPLFPFGHGLTYTTFYYSGLRVNK